MLSKYFFFALKVREMVWECLRMIENDLMDCRVISELRSYYKRYILNLELRYFEGGTSSYLFSSLTVLT